MNEKDIEYFINNPLGPDDTFRFKCRGCGKCCKNREDVLLTARDLYNMAKKLDITVKAAIKEYCEVYIGGTSRMPVVRILSRGVNKVCPLLQDKRCKIRDAKPAVCAMYPVGRTLVAEDEEKGMAPGAPVKAGYILMPTDCGSVKKQYTVRSWLAQFGIPIPDEFYIQWNKMLVYVSPLLSRFEQAGAPEGAMEAIWSAVYQALYLNYDIKQEFAPQFEANSTKLRLTLEILEKELTDAGLLKSSGE